MNKNKTNLSVVNAAGIRVNSNIIVGDQGSYSSGDILDANAVEQVVTTKVDAVVGNAIEALDTLEELGGALPTKVSDLENDTGFITEADVNTNVVSIISNQPFPDTWPTTSSYTLQDLVNAIDADDTAIKGKVYMSTVHYSDLSSAVGLADGELKVEIMESSGSHKIAVFTITSANHSPYYWQNTMWNGSLHDISNVSGKKWVSFAPQSSLATVATSGSYADLSNKPTIPTVPTNVSSFNNDSGYVTQTDITNTVESIEEPIAASLVSIDNRIQDTVQNINDDRDHVDVLEEVIAAALVDIESRVKALEDNQ